MGDSAVLLRVSGGAIDGRLNILRVRQRLFQSLHTVLVKHHDPLLEATQADDGCSREEAQAVFANALIELRNHYDLLDFTRDLDLEYSLARSKSNEHRRTSIALAYIVPDSHNLLFNVVSALGAALEAGSCVVTELGNTTRKTPALLRKIITESLDQDAFGVVQCRAPTEFLARCVVVDQKPGSNNKFSAERVLLSPAYRNIALVDRTGDAKLAAREVIASRFMFGGASNYAVDLVLVNEFVEREFREALSRELAEGENTVIHTGDQPQARGPMNPMVGTEAGLIDRQVKSGAVEFIQGDSSKGILQVHDRRCSVAHRRLPGSRVIVFTTVTSLDDSIDSLSAEGQQTTPIGALYIFAKAREGKYLSQYIQSRATYVNHIPAELSIGPMAPRDYPTNLRIRYTREMFELPSPEIMPGSSSHFVSRLVETADSLDRASQADLKTTGQPESGAWGFFEQGIVLGLIVYILPMVGVTVGVASAGWMGYFMERTSR